MKKLVSLLLVVALALTMLAVANAEETCRIAMITDYGDITDQSFNQTTYEACKAFAEANGLEFTYFKPSGDSTAERVAMVDAAVDADYNVIVMPGYAFAETIAEVAEANADVTFIALDVSEFDLTSAGLTTIPANVFSAVYQEELPGYMAGYAAVKLGYTKLGFMGGMAVPAVIRYGYGFVQGANDAAAETGAEIAIEYAYANQFYGDADITAYCDTWYQTKGTEVVFACGGGVYTSACEAAMKVEGAKVIGVDVDQAAQIDSMYGTEGLVVTSAMKGLAATVNTLLTATVKGEFANYGGKVESLGLVSAEDMDANYVGLPATTQFAEAFTAEDYAALVAGMVNGTVKVDADIAVDLATVANVNFGGNVK